MKFTDPTIRYGRGAVAVIPELIDNMSASRVLIVHGARSFEASGASKLLSTFSQRTWVSHWHDFCPNPDVRELERGLALIQDMRPDTLVGVGGGSAMDMAKLLCALEDVPLGMIEERIRSGALINARRMKLVLAPTTAGSGSEATCFAVVYIGNEKYSVAGQALLPDVAVLDPALSESNSAYQRAASGLDAIAQGIESLWAVDGGGESRGLALRGLRMLLPAIDGFAATPDVGVARSMMVGSHLAGRAINLSKTTGAHALSYGITRRFGVSHGHAVALTLGAFMDAHARATRRDLRPAVRLAAYTRALDDIAALLGAPTPAETGQHFVALARRLGLPMSLSEVGVKSSSEIFELADAVNVKRLSNNPVHFTRDELIELLMRCT